MGKHYEDEWTKSIANMLEKELSKKYIVTCLEYVPYKIDSIDNNIIKYKKYQTDLLIKEKVGNNYIPRLIIESKFGGVTTHDAITYSNKAKDHKNIYNSLRYGIMIGKIDKVPLRLIQHEEYFDFMFTFNNEIPNDNEWKLFIKIIKKNLLISKSIDDMNKNNNYKCIEKDYIFHK